MACRKKAGELVRSEVFQRMRAVRLSETRSAFWRFHTRGVGQASAQSSASLSVALRATADRTNWCLQQNRRRYTVCVVEAVCNVDTSRPSSSLPRLGFVFSMDNM